MLGPDALTNSYPRPNGHPIIRVPTHYLTYHMNLELKNQPSYQQLPAVPDPTFIATFSIFIRIYVPIYSHLRSVRI